ncbi:MAG: heavy metal-associated domain-containing protein, partial [Longimicrobiales bacterium]|nr:heavy metal-associated domain-containing protein [Longimicrobiales bacterium]
MSESSKKGRRDSARSGDAGSTEAPVLDREGVESEGYRSVRYRVRGMHCASCSQAVERALSGVEGVASASVNLAGESASVEYDPSRTGEEELRRTVEDAGYELESDDRTARMTLEIGGMHCSACSNAVERALQGVEGVSSAVVNLTTEKAVVEYP